MAEKISCQSCHDKRTVVCPCCSGKGWVEIGGYPLRLGKAHICGACTGLGEVPCPRCCPEQVQYSRREVIFHRKGAGLRRI